MIDLGKFAKDPYGALNVKKFINATCHWTMFGGTLLPEVSVRSMTAASQYSVDMLENEQIESISNRLHQIVKNSIQHA